MNIQNEILFSKPQNYSMYINNTNEKIIFL